MALSLCVRLGSAAHGSRSFCLAATATLLLFGKEYVWGIGLLAQANFRTGRFKRGFGQDQTTNSGRQENKPFFYLQQELSGKRAALEKAFTQLIAREETDISLTLGLPWLNEGYRIVVCLLDNAAELRSEKKVAFSSRSL